MPTKRAVRWEMRLGFLNDSSYHGLRIQSRVFNPQDLRVMEHLLHPPRVLPRIPIEISRKEMMLIVEFLPPVVLFQSNMILLITAGGPCARLDHIPSDPALVFHKVLPLRILGHEPICVV